MADTGKRLWFVKVRHEGDEGWTTHTTFNLVGPKTLAAVQRDALACAKDLGLRKVEIRSAVSRGTIDEPAQPQKARA
jgi:predicted xylose isomerase-like sugar epimerase